MQNAILLEDESLRDGLQFEKAVIPLHHKVEIFQLLARAGVQRIQVGSFVNPKVVPQMADTDELIKQLKDTTDVELTGLVLNERGLDRAASSGLRHISLSASVSDTHSRKNVRKSADEALASLTAMIKEAKNLGITVRAGLQCVFGCVYEGQVPEDRVFDGVEKIAAAGADECNLADTTGMAHPRQISRLIKQIKNLLPDMPLSLHLHDTRGLGIANMMAGYDAGVRAFDTSAGGLGGCPFVKGAAGNVATEDAVHLFEQMNIDTGISLPAICAVAEYYENLLGRQLPGRMSRVMKTMQLS